MANTVSCPHCQAAYTLEQVGHLAAFTCGSCGKDVAVQHPTGRGRRHESSSMKARSKKKSPMPFVLMGAGAIVAVVLVIVIMSSNKGGQGDAGGGGQGAAQTSPEELGEREVAKIKGTADLGTAAGCYEVHKRLLARADELKNSADEVRMANVLRREGLVLKDKVLVLDPDFLPMRTERKEAKYDGKLKELLHADWLLETDRIEAKKLHERVDKVASASAGWVPADSLEPVTKFMERIAPKLAARAELENTPFFKTATELATDIKADLEQRFADLPAGQYRGVSVTIEKPYVFLIQTDPSWDPVHVAKGRAHELKSLEDIIFQEYGASLGLKPIEDPVPVLFFRNYDMYKKYAGLDPSSSTLAHFEPTTGRLAVHDGCDHPTIMHEGTHQLMWAWTEKKGRMMDNTLGRSYWFQEGIAEWYGGASRVPKADGTYEYEIGLLHEGRLSNIRQLQTDESRNRLFTLKELLSRIYAHRPMIESQGRTGALYAQGWFFIYFMNHFNVDEKGMVHPDKPGKYQEKWRKYVEAELKGRTGLKVFHEIMGTDDESLAAMEVEFWRFQEYIQKKSNLKQIQNKRVIAWDKWRNKKGEATGEPDDDILPPFNPENAPPPKNKEGG